MNVHITWLVRFGHVASACLWLGGTALLALLLLPQLQKHWDSGLQTLALGLVRLLTYSGTATIFFGLLLIQRSRGFASLKSAGEWGLLVGGCLGIAITLMGLGDGALRPALRQMPDPHSGRRARLLAGLSFLLLLLALGLMTRALYAPS